MTQGLSNTSILNQGMLWWIGQIADDSTWRDNMLPGKFKNPEQIPGWGYRYKVRIMGIHDHGGKEGDPIPEDQLPWANIMYPVIAGGGQGGSYITPNLRQGNIVFGFWLDGQDMQTPVIMGVLGNNAQTALSTTIGKVDEAGVTNTQNGSIAKSGFPNKQEVSKPGNRGEKVPASNLRTMKPVKKDIAKEAASLVDSKVTNQPSPQSETPGSQNQSRKKKNQSRLDELRAKTAARENQVGNRVGDKVTNAEILKELEAERNFGLLR